MRESFSLLSKREEKFEKIELRYRYTVTGDSNHQEIKFKNEYQNLDQLTLNAASKTSKNKKRR